jgi:hypothetical protein
LRCGLSKTEKFVGIFGFDFEDEGALHCAVGHFYRRVAEEDFADSFGHRARLPVSSRALPGRVDQKRSGEKMGVRTWLAWICRGAFLIFGFWDENS